MLGKKLCPLRAVKGLILNGEMVSAMDFGSEVGQMWLNFVPNHNHKSTQPHLPHGPADDPFKTINYHHLDISGHDGMDEQDIGWRNGRS
jgi:hypothetical protein